MRTNRTCGRRRSLTSRMPSGFFGDDDEPFRWRNTTVPVAASCPEPAIFLFIGFVDTQARGARRRKRRPLRIRGQNRETPDVRRRLTRILASKPSLISRIGPAANRREDVDVGAMAGRRSLRRTQGTGGARSRSTWARFSVVAGMDCEEGIMPRRGAPSNFLLQGPLSRILAQTLNRRCASPSPRRRRRRGGRGLRFRRHSRSRHCRAARGPARRAGSRRS